METVRSINDWGCAKFGERSVFNAAVRANLEMAELLALIVGENIDKEKLALEAADVIIVLCRPAVKLLPYPEKVAEYITTKLPEIMKGYTVDTSIVFKPHFTVAARSLAEFVDMAVSCNEYETRIGEATAIELGRKLFRIVELLSHGMYVSGINLWDAVEQKMAINRKRQWKLDENGFGQHIETQAAE